MAAHISLLYPFVPHNQFPDILAKLTEVGTRVRPFRLSFTEFGYFSHGKNSSTVWLGPDTQPENALQRLEEELVKAFPEFNDLMVRSATFSPHLTVGQFGAKVKAAPLFCFLFGFCLDFVFFFFSFYAPPPPVACLPALDVTLT